MKEFLKGEKAGGSILIFCTILSLFLSNFLQDRYTSLWHFQFAGASVSHWINDGLMAVFFLLIGLELKRELLTGELSSPKKAMLPAFAAAGGMLVPALIYVGFNYGTKNISGVGIPVATDIAFALAVLSILGKRVPTSLKVFLTALAVIDDMGAIAVIAVGYTKDFSLFYFGSAICLFGVLLILNRLKIYQLLVYLAGGVLMWYCMLNSGVHASITGILLAFSIPIQAGEVNAAFDRLQKSLHKPVTFIILPLFALANTAILLHTDWTKDLTSGINLGIGLGLILGKPLGIFLFSYFLVKVGWGKLPSGLQWKHIAGAGLLGGIGFTMSIFISLLAFDDHQLINNSKIAVLIASAISGCVGFFWLKATLK